MNFFILFDLVFAWPHFFILLCLIGALLFAFTFYFRTNKDRELSRLVYYTLFGLRVLLIFLLAIFLIEPMLRYKNIEKEKPILVVALDNSQSMVMNKDSSWIKNNLVENLKSINEKLGDKFSVVNYHFSSGINQGLPSRFDGKETDFSGLFNEVENNYSGRNLGALLICSDGIINKGINPIYSNRDLKFPVYTFALGDTTELKDLYIKKINHNPVTYLGNQFPAEVVLQGKKLKGNKGNISISKDGKVIEQRAFDVSSSNWTQSFNFLFNADKPGIAR
ncbi:MAG: hypothetical protein ACK452_04560, partial [Bacteroidota bacterium]